MRTIVWDVDDVLNDLIQVSQGAQTRTFAYDSLKRLTNSSNPESGTVTFDAYDNNGNVLVTTDARGVSTHASYDELNRPTRRWYNSSNSTSSTTNNSPATDHSTLAALPKSVRIRTGHRLGAPRGGIILISVASNPTISASTTTAPTANKSAA